MYIFKNALKNVTRIKGRSILIGIVVLIIATSSCLALSIKNSASSLVESYKNENEIEAKITLDRVKMRDDMKNKSSSGDTKPNPVEFMANISEIDMNMVKDYGNSEYVKSYTYSANTNLNANGIEKVTMEESSNNVNIPQDIGRGRIGNGGSSKNTGDFQIVGYGDLNSMTEFLDSSYKITYGEIFDTTSSENLCLISNELAENNELKVGDSITLVNPNDETKTVEFKIKGIYEDNTESTEFTMFSNAANKILTTYTALNNFVSLSEDTENKIVTTTDATFILQNESSIEPFLEELQNKGLSEYYTLTTNVDTINESIKPLENLDNFAIIFFIVVLVIGGVILVIVNMINIRERKYEIGVLRAIGMKKKSVLLQFITESFIVTFTSIVIGIVIGSLISVPTANVLLKNEIESKQSKENKISENFGMNQGIILEMPQNRGGTFSGTPDNKMDKKDIRDTFANNANYIDKINAVINIKTVGELILIGLALTLMSSSISMIFISRYTPLKILSNRS